jgi:hypothetical protein
MLFRINMVGIIIDILWKKCILHDVVYSDLCILFAKSKFQKWKHQEKQIEINVFVLISFHQTLNLSRTIYVNY